MKIPVTFKPELSLNLASTLYFEPSLPMFIINGYDSKANACSPWTSCFCYISGVLIEHMFENLHGFHSYKFYNDKLKTTILCKHVASSLGQLNFH